MPGEPPLDPFQRASQRVRWLALIGGLLALIVIGLLYLTIDQSGDTAEEVTDKAEESDVEANTERIKRRSRHAKDRDRQIRRLVDRRFDRALAGLKQVVEAQEGPPGKTVKGPLGPISTAPGPKGDKGEPGADSTVPGPASTVPGPSGADSTVPGPQGEPPSDEQVSNAVALWFADHQADLQAMVEAVVADYFETHTFICEPTEEVDDPPDRQRCAVEPTP